MIDTVIRQKESLGLKFKSGDFLIAPIDHVIILINLNLEIDRFDRIDRIKIVKILLILLILSEYPTQVH